MPHNGGHPGCLLPRCQVVGGRAVDEGRSFRCKDAYHISRAVRVIADVHVAGQLLEELVPLVYVVVCRGCSSGRLTYQRVERGYLRRNPVYLVNLAAHLAVQVRLQAGKVGRHRVEGRAKHLSTGRHGLFIGRVGRVRGQGLQELKKFVKLVDRLELLSSKTLWICVRYCSETCCSWTSLFLLVIASCRFWSK